jgi:hypothetical protein
MQGFISFLFILSGIIYASSATQFETPLLGSTAAALHGNIAKPTKSIERANPSSTPCEPLPWSTNREFESMGFEIRNTWFKSQVWKNEYGEVTQNREQIFFHIVPSDFISPKEAETTYGLQNWPPRLRINLMQGNSTSYYSDGFVYDPNSSTWENRVWDFNKARFFPSMEVGKDLFFVMQVPPGLQKYTFAAQTPNDKRTFFFVNRKQSIDPEITNIDSGVSNLDQCSTFFNPHPFDKVLSSENVQVQAIDYVSLENIPNLLASSDINTSIEPGYQLEAIRFLFRNTGDSTYSPFSLKSGGLSSTGSFATAMIGTSGKMYGGEFLNSNVTESSFFPYGSFIETIVYKIPENEKIAKLEVCFECSSHDYLPLNDWRSTNYERSELFDHVYSKLNLHYITLENSNKLSTTERTSSDSHKQSFSPVIGTLGETLRTNTYDLTVNKIYEGNDALDKICNAHTDESCKYARDTLNKQITYFEMKNKVTLTLMHVTIILHPYLTNDTNYHFKNFSVRGIESSECKQFSFETDMNSRLGSSSDCIALEPNVIHTDQVPKSGGANVYEFPNFQNAFDFRGRYVTGAKVSGWIRVWAPTKTGNKMLVIDPFGINFGRKGTSERLYKQGDVVYISYK